MEKKIDNKVGIVIISIIILITIAFTIKKFISRKMEITTNTERLQETVEEEVEVNNSGLRDVP